MAMVPSLHVVGPPVLRHDGRVLRWLAGPRASRSDAGSHQASYGGYSLVETLDFCRPSKKRMWDREIETRRAMGYAGKGEGDIYIDLTELLRIVYAPGGDEDLQVALSKLLAPRAATDGEPSTRDLLDITIGVLIKEDPDAVLRAAMQLADDDDAVLRRLEEFIVPASPTATSVGVRVREEGKKQKLERIWTSLSKEFPGGDEGLIDGLAVLFASAPGVLFSVFHNTLSRETRDAVLRDTRARHRVYHQIFAGETRRITTASQYSRLRKTLGHIEAVVHDFPDLLNLSDPHAVEQMALNLDTGPALEKFTFEFDDDGGVTGVGATCDLDDLLLWVLGFPEVQSAIARHTGIVIKVNFDGVHLLNTSNVTIFSIVILVPGSGLSSRHVNIQAVYVGDCVKASTRLQHERIRMFRREHFRCASRTRRERSIRPKISRIDFDLAELG